MSAGDTTMAVRFGAKIVAVEGHAHDWAAYAAPASWEREQVARNGDKISEEEARMLFPQFADLYYRP